MANLHTYSGGLICGSCKQPCPESATFVDLLVSTNIILCGTNRTRLYCIFDYFKIHSRCWQKGLGTVRPRPIRPVVVKKILYKKLSLKLFHKPSPYLSNTHLIYPASI